MTLDDLTLHPKTKKQAWSTLASMPHSLIIEGQSGVGVAFLARAMARELGSPNLVLLPKRKEKNEYVIDEKNGNIVIEDIRELYLRTRSKQSEKHVYILDTGEKSLTLGAQNAFLKLLEEPRDNVHFIIATHHLEMLLPTIQSRCQQITVHNISDDQTMEFINNLDVDDETKIKRLAFVGRGKPALIARLARDKQTYDERVNIMTDAKSMLSSNNYDKICIANRYNGNRADSLTLVDDIIYQLTTVLKGNPNPEIARTIDKFSDVYDSIRAGGNIRLQIASRIL